MHIPDGFLSTPVWATLNVATVPAVGYMARRARVHLEESRVPLLGVLGAFVFAAQMVNFPVGPGTSGHLVGGTLLACTLGPASASLVMTAILIVQALLFQDGGVLALGANVMSMGVLGVIAGYLPYHFFGRGRYRWASILAGGTFSVLASATAAIVFLWLSGVRMPAPVMTVPLALFVVAAVLEGVITVAVLRALERMHPEFVRKPNGSGGRAILALATAAVALAAGGFLVASAWPDGLERMSESLGIAPRATTLLAAPFADYEAPFLRTEWLRQAVPGIAGLMTAALACLVAGRLLARRRGA